jgi:hypothetical protein
MGKLPIVISAEEVVVCMTGFGLLGFRRLRCLDALVLPWLGVPT